MRNFLSANCFFFTLRTRNPVDRRLWSWEQWKSGGRKRRVWLVPACQFDRDSRSALNRCPVNRERSYQHDFPFIPAHAAPPGSDGDRGGTWNGTLCISVLENNVASVVHSFIVSQSSLLLLIHLICHKSNDQLLSRLSLIPVPHSFTLGLKLICFTNPFHHWITAVQPVLMLK